MMHWIQSSRKLIGGGWLRRLWFRRFDQNLKDVRPARLMYMLIFPLAPVFANMQESVLLGQPRLWGLDAMSLMGRRTAWAPGCCLRLPSRAACGCTRGGCR